jgi:hypothetical protein
MDLLRILLNNRTLSPLGIRIRKATIRHLPLVERIAILDIDIIRESEHDDEESSICQSARSVATPV